METAVPIPTSIEQVNSSWLNSVLDLAEIAAKVDDLRVAPIGTGQMASSLRLVPSYAGPTDAPASFVLKIASDDPNSRAAGARGAYLREVRFYQELADGLPVATPASYWAAIDPGTNDFAILLQDMAPANQGDQIAGAAVDDLVSATTNIAGLHAPHWCDETLLTRSWLAAPPAEQLERATEIQGLLAMLTPGFIDRYRARIDDGQAQLLTWFVDASAEWIVEDHGRFGLCHGDHRLDNLLFDPEGLQPVTVVDWQTVAVRNPLADISYLLGTSLEPAARRAFEHDAVDLYCDELIALNVRGVDRATCFEDYRRQTPHSLLLTVLGSMLTVQTDRGDDMFMAMLHRSSQQMFDLDVV